MESTFLVQRPLEVVQADLIVFTSLIELHRVPTKAICRVVGGEDVPIQAVCYGRMEHDFDSGRRFTILDGRLDLEYWLFRFFTRYLQSDDAAADLATDVALQAADEADEVDWYAA